MNNLRIALCTAGTIMSLLTILVLSMKSPDEVKYGMVNLTGISYVSTGSFHCVHSRPDPPHSFCQMFMGEGCWSCDQKVEMYNPCLVYNFNDRYFSYCNLDTLVKLNSASVETFGQNIYKTGKYNVTNFSNGSVYYRMSLLPIKSNDDIISIRKTNYYCDMVSIILAGASVFNFIILFGSFYVCKNDRSTFGSTSGPFSEQTSIRDILRYKKAHKYTCTCDEV